VIPDWKTNTVLFADLLRRRFPELLRRLSTLLRARHIPHGLVKDSKDVWLRDFAPIQSTLRSFVQFEYRPDYLKGYSNTVTSPQVFKRLSFLTNIRNSQLTIDGGNLVSDGSAAILTDKVFEENPDHSRKEIERELKAKLTVKRLIFIPQEPGDPIGHADGMVRFIGKGQVVASDYSESDKTFDDELMNVLVKHDLAIERLPYVPTEPLGKGIPSAVGNYVNFLRVGNLIFMPAYGLPEDRRAATRIASYIPNAEVIAVACRKLAHEGGVLNCATWTVRTSGHIQGRTKPSWDKPSWDKPGETNE
jgi:agmatine deiminase